MLRQGGREREIKKETEGMSGFTFEEHSAKTHLQREVLL